MRMDPEYREAKGLEKEMKMFQRYATRPGAPKLEANYYANLAQKTGNMINWKALNRKPRKDKEERKEYDYEG